GGVGSGWAQDLYEPDNSALLASIMLTGSTQFHDLHLTNDEDWVRFHAITGGAYEIEVEQLGTNVNLVLDLYFENLAGQLEPVATDVNASFGGVGMTEAISIDMSTNSSYRPGNYLLRVTTAVGFGGIDSDYEVRIFVPVGAGMVLVGAVDSLIQTNSPPGAFAVLDGVDTLFFSNGATSVEFPVVDPGYHTLEVCVNPGYFPVPHPTLEGQETNLNSLSYGNPRETNVIDLMWNDVLFQFQALSTIQGVVKDGFTGARVAGANIEFRARNGTISNAVYNGFPQYATYKSNWVSEVSGGFPPHVFLPMVDWDLMVTMSGYVETVQSNRLSGLQPGLITNLGVIVLMPIDVNTNGIADDWEMDHFGMLISATNDPDMDRQNNHAEYIAGTDPNDEDSVLNLNVNIAPPLDLHWPSSP
ncbi:MAG: hypothetical protein AAF492_27140, partial [Verrucomicrobiota bacterium]